MPIFVPQHETKETLVALKTLLTLQLQKPENQVPEVLPFLRSALLGIRVALDNLQRWCETCQRYGHTQGSTFCPE
jgi:hypothetical protein